MADTILKKESVVDFWVSSDQRNDEKYLLNDYQFVYFKLLNHHFHPRSVSPFWGKREERVGIRMSFKNLEAIIIIAEQLEQLLDVYPGRLRKLLDVARSSEQKNAEEETLSVKLDMEKEVSSGEDMSVSGMVYYERTELAHTLLRKAINAYSNILHMAEYRQDPRAKAMDLREVRKSRDIAQETLRIASFDSLDEMDYIIDTYSAIVKELYRA